MKIESTDQDVRTMLSSAYYKIPRFQRPYSWDRENLVGQIGYEEAVIGQLGNLILVSDELNGRLKNKPFKDKKRILLDHGCKLPKVIETASAWTASEITKRTELMAEEAYNDVWKP